MLWNEGFFFHFNQVMPGAVLPHCMYNLWMNKTFSSRGRWDFYPWALQLLAEISSRVEIGAHIIPCRCPVPCFVPPCELPLSPSPLCPPLQSLCVIWCVLTSMSRCRVEAGFPRRWCWLLLSVSFAGVSHWLPVSVCTAALLCHVFRPSQWEWKASAAGHWHINPPKRAHWPYLNHVSWLIPCFMIKHKTFSGAHLLIRGGWWPRGDVLSLILTNLLREGILRKQQRWKSIELCTLVSPWEHFHFPQ